MAREEVTLVLPIGRTHYSYMVTSPEIPPETSPEDAVREALRLNPGSTLALAKAAQLSEGLLRMIRDGERTATPATVEALAAALDQWTHQTADAATILRDSLTTITKEKP